MRVLVTGGCKPSSIQDLFRLKNEATPFKNVRANNDQVCARVGILSYYGYIESLASEAALARF